MAEPADDFALLRAAPAFSAVEEWAGLERYLLGVGDGTFSLYGERAGAAHFDLEGRWTRAMLGGRSLLRGLDGRVLERSRRRGGDVVLDEAARGAVHAEVHRFVCAAGAAREAVPVLEARAQPLTLSLSPGGEGMARPVVLLDAARGWTPERLLGEQARFLTVYRPLGIVPPDRYRSLILQVTHGCAYNVCLFCELYRGQRARVVPPDELREHARAVKRFVGSGLTGRRGLFLGEANALATPQPALLQSFAVLEDELPGLLHSRADRAGGVSSFIDAFTTSDKGAQEYAALAARGLRRVFLGVESGDPQVLAFLRKPATAEGVRAVVGALKEGGVSVGAILLVGAGGRGWSAQHVARSAALVGSLALGPTDLVYLSPLVAEPGGRFAREATRAGLEVPGADELAHEEAEHRRALAAAGVTAQIARYDVRRFVYG